MIDWGEHHREWLERTIGATLEPTAQFLANSKPYGVVGFERYTGDDVEVHVAGDRGFLTRRFLRALAHYAFNDLGCARVTGRVPDFRPASLDVGLHSPNAIAELDGTVYFLASDKSNRLRFVRING